MGRTVKRISKKIEDLLINQIAHELKNFTLYRSYANFFATKGINDLYEYYHKRSEEEMKHHDWIYAFLSDGDSDFMYPAVEKNDQIITDYESVFHQTIAREIQTTELIYKIYDAAKEEGDSMTQSWLLELLIKEQVEEEDTSRNALDIMQQDDNIFHKAEKVLELLG
jgi:ferritin